MMRACPGDFTVDTCLNPKAMRALLQQALPDFADSRLAISHLRIVKARRSASHRRNPNPLTLCYEIDARDTATGGACVRQFYGKVYRDGASLNAAHGTSALHLPQLDMLLWPWPADPGLPQLPGLLDTRQALARWSEPAGAVRVIHYEPEQRATLRYELAPGRTGPQALFAKTFCDDRGALIQRRFEYFWALAQQDDLAPRVAQPLGWHADTRTAWQAQVHGKPLRQVLDNGLTAGLPQRLTRALAALHAAPLNSDMVHDTAHWLHETRRRQSKIGRAVPELAARVARVADAIEQAASTLPVQAPALIHGDFHHGQVGIDGQRIVLFDFDEFALGDPMEDLAAFLTRLPGGAVPAKLGTLMQASYAQAAPARFSRRRLQWHLAMQQLLQASRAFVFQLPNWRAELERRLARVESLCAPSAMESVT